MLQIDKTEEGDVLLLELAGRLDTVSAPELKEVLADSLAGINRLVLDLAQLEYTSSAGLRVLLEAYKTMAGRDGMTVRNVNSSVMKVFDSVGFSRFVDIR